MFTFTLSFHRLTFSRKSFSSQKSFEQLAMMLKFFSTFFYHKRWKQIFFEFRLVTRKKNSNYHFRSWKKLNSFWLVLRQDKNSHHRNDCLSKLLRSDDSLLFSSILFTFVVKLFVKKGTGAISLSKKLEFLTLMLTASRLSQNTLVLSFYKSKYRHTIPEVELWSMKRKIDLGLITGRRNYAWKLFMLEGSFKRFQWTM